MQRAFGQSWLLSPPHTGGSFFSRNFGSLCRLCPWQSPRRASSAGCSKCCCTAWPATKVPFTCSTALPHRELWSQRWIPVGSEIHPEQHWGRKALFLSLYGVASPSNYYFGQYQFSGSVVCPGFHGQYLHFCILDGVWVPAGWHWVGRGTCTVGSTRYRWGLSWTSLTFNGFVSQFL